MFKFNLNIRQDPLLRHLEGALPVGDGPLTQVWLFFFVKNLLFSNDLVCAGSLSVVP